MGKMGNFNTALLTLFCLALAQIALGESTPPRLRLPEDVQPLSYSADLHIDPSQEKFRAVIRIELDISRPVSTIWLNARSLEFQSAALRIKEKEESVRIAPAGDDYAAVATNSGFPPGPALLTIHYTGEISRTLTDGAFAQKHGSDWYVFTKFEPVTARRVFPCFDEPSFKVPWQLTLHFPSGLKAFSNTLPESEQQASDDTTIRFRQTKPLSSYLVAFAVGPFDVVPTGSVGQNHRPSRIIVPRGRAPEAAYAASITPKLIQMLEEYFGTPYPYEKLDQIVVPLTTAWGAMENAGLIAYGDFLLSSKEEDSELRQRSRASTMEHEMSHQWFGDLVTTAWWNDIWLNEAFASWISRKLLNEWKPEWNLITDAARSMNVMRADSLSTARKIRQPIEAPGDIANAFDGITYGKGEAVIAMFENYVTPDKFQRAVRLYLKQHAWKNATSADLMSAIDTVAGPGNGAAFSTFLNQVGFPEISVSVTCTGQSASLNLQQKPFHPLGSQGATNASWGVPVCAKWRDDGGTHEECTLLKNAAAEVHLDQARGCPAWLFADANAAGYYAVSYDAPLSSQLAEKGLPELKPAEAAAALRNTQLLFSSGVGDAEQELRSIVSFSRNPDPDLVHQASDTIDDLDEFVPQDLRANYAALIRSLFGAKAHALGWQPKPGESEETHELRIDLLSLVVTSGDDPELRSQAIALAHEWLHNRSAIPPDMVVSVLWTAAYASGRSFFDELVAAIKNTKVQRERLWMISAIRGFRDPAIARSAVELIFGSGIDPRELSRLLQNAQPETRETVWQFAQANFDRLNATLPGARGIPFAATLPFSAAGFCDEAHRAELHAFFEPRLASLPGAERNLANTEERISFCAARAAIDVPAVTNLLRSYHQTRNGNSDAVWLRPH